MAKQATPVNLDLFDINGPDKLSLDSVEQRQAIVKHYAKDPNCLFFVSTSGGKDSDRMSIVIREMVPASQIIYVHANLGEHVEHPGIVEHIKRYIPEGSEFHIVKNERKDFIEMVLLRGMFPSPQHRQCTSDLKTSQIDKLIRQVMKARGAKVGFNVMGLRSQESVPRSKRFPLTINTRLTTKSDIRVVYDYLPIFHESEDSVFEGICAAGQEPFHIYGIKNINNKPVRAFKGNVRTSCRFCIMASGDLTNAANWYPNEYALMRALELTVDHTMFFRTVKKEPVKVSLVEKAGVPVDEVAVRRWQMILNERRNQLLEAKRIEDKEKAEKRIARLAEKGARFVDQHTIAMF